MSSKKELESPLLFGSQSDYTGGGGVGAPIEPTIAHAHSHETAAVNVEDVKFGEYVSRAKARATNKLKIFGCIPFHVVMLLCIMFLSFGGYWCYDIPGSIETQLTAWFGGSYGHSSNSLFYSIYSWPNCILAFFGGVILDKFTGVRKGALLFCGLVALGQLIFSLGCQWKVYYLALFGRFVFGLGSESLGVAQNTFTVRWFDGKGLALAFGLVVAFSRIGTSVNFVVSPILASSPIAFEQNFYLDKDCSNISPIFQPIEGDMNECVAGRYLDCESEEPNDDTPTSLVFYSTVDGLCDAANQTTSIQFQADKCFHTPAPWNATHLSARIQLVPESTEYLIQLYTDAECTSKETSLTTGSDVTPLDLFTVSEGPLKVYGQGNGCFNGTVGGANFRVTQPIETLCYVATYSDMLCNGRELNRYGMKRDTCYVPLDPSRPPYQFAIHPGNGVPLTLWIGMLMCGVSMTACILASTTDFWGEKKVEADRQKYMATLSPEEAAYVRKLDDMNEPASDDISFKMIKKIPISAWILFLIIGVFYVAILNFYQVASDILQHTGDHIDDNTAGLYMAIPNFVAIIGSPLGGFTVDRVGRALVLICVACTMLICSHVFFLALAYGWITFTPVPVMLWLGCTYSLGASCLIPILAFIVDKDTLGTAYGCMTSVQNLFLAVAALAIGQLQDWAKSSHPGVLQYTLPIMIFIGCASIGLLLTILLIFVDARNGGKLNASAAERAERLKREEIEQEARNQATATGSVPLAVEANTSSEDDFVNSSPSNSVNGSKHY